MELWTANADGQPDHEGHRDLVKAPNHSASSEARARTIRPCSRRCTVARPCPTAYAEIARICIRASRSPRNDDGSVVTVSPLRIDGKQGSRRNRRRGTACLPQVQAPMPLTVKQATLDLLRAFGIKKVFGNPGSTELPFLSDWPDDIDYVLGLQEACVVGMADGYAQATRNAGFVNLHSAAGVGNALGNIYTAHRNQTPLVITAGQQARSILPLQAVPLRRARLRIPAALRQIQRRAGARRGRAGGDRARLLRGDAAALRADFRVGADRRLDAACAGDRSRAASAARSAPSRRRCRRWSTALSAAKNPALVVGPAIDRAGAVDLMVQVAEKAQGRGLGQPVLGALHLPRTASAIRGLPARLAGAIVRSAARPRPRGRDRRAGVHLPCRGPCRDLRRRHHASSRSPTIPTRPSVTPLGTSIIATMKPALSALLELLPETKRAAPPGRALPPAPQARRSDRRSNICCTRCRRRCPTTRLLVEEAPSHRPGDAEIHADARAGQFLHHGERRPRLLAAGRRSASRSAAPASAPSA